MLATGVSAQTARPLTGGGGGGTTPSCNMLGPTTVAAGSRQSYSLSCTQTPIDILWTVTGGTIVSGGGSEDPSVTVVWNSDGTTSGSVFGGSSTVGESATNHVTITYSPLTVGAASSSQTLNYPDVPQPVTCAAAAGGRCSGNYQYQWQKSTDNVNFSDISGQTSGTFQPPSTGGVFYYRMKVVCSAETVYSNSVSITIYMPLAAGTLSPAVQNILYNQSPSPITLSNTSGGNLSYQYQWQESSDENSWSNLGDPTTTPTPVPSYGYTYYRVQVTSNGAVSYSNVASINYVLQVIPGTVYPSEVTTAINTHPGIISSTLPTRGGCGGNYIYQWQSSTDGTNFTDITGAASLDYTPPALQTTTWYRLKVICGGDTEYTNICHVTVNANNTDLSYVRERDILKPGITDLTSASLLTDPGDVHQSTQYMDGLGRTIQTVARQASPLQKDMVSMQQYDSLMLQPVVYLPYVSPSSDGSFKINPIGEQGSFYSGLYPSEQDFYSKTDYEPSPLSRVTAVYAPGSSWVASQRGSSANYLVNTTADSVRYWTIAYTSGSLPVSSSAYAGGTLFKSLKVNEAGHQVIAYTDQLGKLILQREQSSDNPGTAHMGWLNTYYVYDDFGNLRTVIAPKAVEWLLANGWNYGATGGATVAAELNTRYEYDQRNRIVVEKRPGSGERWLVYDARDRTVMSQDSLGRHDGFWIITKYDNLNRVDSTGKLVDPNNQSYHQGLAGVSSNYPAISGTGYTSYTRIFYDDYSWLPAGTPTLNANFSTKYVNNNNYFITAVNTGPVYAQPLVSSVMTKGAVTGAVTDIIGSSFNLYRVNFYDDRGRLLQTISTNFQAGRDTTTIQYDFTGKPLRKLLTHQDPASATPFSLALTKVNYDAGGRPTSSWMRLDNATADQMIDSTVYNELGQAKVTNVGNFLESMEYDYTVRGWLNGINRDYIAGTANHFFGMELGYDKAASVASGTVFSGLQFNGNIAGLVWKSAGDQVARKYDLSYDVNERLNEAIYKQSDPSSGWGNSKMDFSVHNLQYDANGNMLNMSQHGYKLGSPSSPIDSLTYQNVNNGYSNRLNRVYDAVNDTASMLGDFHYKSAKQQSGSDADYKYDGNGNMSADANKGITSIFYNFLGLPSAITLKGKGAIQYDYDAGGNKVRKIVWDSVSKHVYSTIYTEGFVYTNTDSFVHNPNMKDTLQFVVQAEGRARWALHHYTNGSSAYGWEYDFFEKDNQGNTRVILTQQKDTMQYMATMEAAYRAKEMALFYNIDSTSYPAASVPGGYPADATTNPNDSVARVSGTPGSHKMGPALLLKVMSGDALTLGVKSFYRSNGSPGGNNSQIPDVLNSLAQGLISVAGPGHGAMADLNNTSGSPVYAALNSFMPANETVVAGKPKAYLNWMLLDNQFNYVSGGGQSGAVQVGSPDVLNTLGQAVNISHSGYLYVWVSNETANWDVFFDNLSVEHRPGPMVEENHYYPFGLGMAAISDKAIKAGYAENKYRYNSGSELQNKEFSDGSGLELYETPLRGYDPQIGRFHQIDPLAGQDPMHSPYAYCGNNPILFFDPTGAKRMEVTPNAFVNNVIGDWSEVFEGGSGGWGSGVSAGIDGPAASNSSNSMTSWADFDNVVKKYSETQFGGEWYTLGGKGRSFDTEEDAEWSAAAESYVSGQAGDGVIAAAGLETPAVAIGKFNEKDQWYTTNEDDLQKQLQGNGAGYQAPGSGWLRLPDYISLNVSVGFPVLGPVGIGWSGSISLDRYGTIHYSPIGVAVGVGRGEASASLTANWLIQSKVPSKEQMNSFLNGHGINVGAGFIGGAAYSYTPGSGSAIGIGLFSPQVGASYNYTPEAFSFPNEYINW